jgi:PKD repeat protein
MSRRIALVTCMLFVSAAPLAAQTFPMPASTPNQIVPCTVPACLTEYKGTQTIGYPSPPYKSFVGRYVDSAQTNDSQAPFRTVRAGFIKIVPENGLHGRIYMRIGGALAAYDLGNFFGRIVTPPVGIDTKFRVFASPAELYQPWDQYLYPEQENFSGWSTTGNNPDGQDRLFDMDWDDRGFLYVAYGPFGWGIARDDNASDGRPFTFVFQNKVGENGVEFAPHSVLVVKSGVIPYLLVSDDRTNVTAVYDLTNPATPQLIRSNIAVTLGSGQDAHFSARNAARSHVAVISSSLLTIYPAQFFVNGAATPQTFPGIFKTVVFDGNTLWATEIVNGNLSIDRFTQGSGGTYTKAASFPTGAAGAGYIPFSADFQSGYMVLTTQSGVYDVRAFKMSSGTPEFVDLGSYVTGYYSTPPAGNARATHLTLYDSAIYVQNNRTYLMLAFSSLGDVYEIAGTDGVNASVVRIGETANPNRPPSAPSGPFPGDIVTFSGARSNGAPADLKWRFGAGTGPSSPLLQNTVTIPSGQIKHQFWDVTASDFTAPRTVTAQDNADPSVAGSVDLRFSRPSARVAVKAGGQILMTFSDTLTTAPAPLIVEDKLVDASDGSVESHFGNFQLAGPSPLGASATPLNETMPASGPSEFCGAYIFNYTAHYGAYDPSTFALLAGTDFPVALPAIHYNIQPFVLNEISYAPSTPGNIAFNATARVPANPALIVAPGTRWTVTWRLGAGPAQTTSETIGTIPPFTIPVASILPGARVALTAAIPNGSVISNTCQATASQTKEILPALPDPQLVAAQTCINTGDPCSVSDVTAADDPAWTYSWMLSFNNTPVATSGNGKRFDFPTNLRDGGDYTVTLRVANVFGFKDAVPLTVRLIAPGPTCAPTFDANHVFPAFTGSQSGCTRNSVSGGSQLCTAGENIAFTVNTFGYDLSCTNHFYTWIFNDGTGATSSQRNATHAFPGPGTFNVQMIVSNASTTVQGTVAVRIPGEDLCAVAPTAAALAMTYSGSPSNCSTANTTDCTSTDTVTFDLTPVNYTFHGCDLFDWDFGDGSPHLSVKTPTHQFIVPTGTSQTFTVRVTVTNTKGSVTLQKAVNVTNRVLGACTEPPVAIKLLPKFSGETSGCTNKNATPCKRNETITFDMDAILYTFHDCDRVVWQFGDGATASGRTASHAYGGSAQSFQASATVTNDLGTVTLGPLTIPFEPATALDFTINPQAPIRGTTVKFSVVTPVPGAVRWEWSFGDGNGSIRILPDSTFAEGYAVAGTYTVQVTAKNAAGAPLGSATREVIVKKPKPRPSPH